MDLRRLRSTIDAYIGELPHPDAPGVPIKEYQAHERVAAMMKNPQSAHGEDIEQAYHMLRQMEMSPAEWEHAWKLARPLANRLLDRDPDPQELSLFKGFVHPGDVLEYYSSHPHPQFPEISAGEMMRYFHAATPIAGMNAKRKPTLGEVARFAAAGYDDQDILAHYTHKGGNR